MLIFPILYALSIRLFFPFQTRVTPYLRRPSQTEFPYCTVLEAQLAAIDAITEGAKNADMDKTARDLIYGAGYEGCFGHGLGHGVGLEIHEAPGLSGGAGEATLKPGQIVTVEPGVYLEGKYGCRIEDMVLVTPGGKRNLTDCPKEMIEI